MADVVIVDYGAGNLRSVARAVAHATATSPSFALGKPAKAAIASDAMGGDNAPDMVINIPPVDDVSLYIEEQLYAQGVLGEVAGNAAVKITKILEE